MDEKEQFRKWWEENGKRGISFCECNYTKSTLKKVRAWVQEFKGVTPVIKPSRKAKIVQINDLHIPHHDKKTLEIFYGVLEGF